MHEIDRVMMVPDHAVSTQLSSTSWNLSGSVGEVWGSVGLSLTQSSRVGHVESGRMRLVRVESGRSGKVM